MAKCRQCKYYEKVPKKRHGYCRKPNGYYEGFNVTGAKKAADRCFEKRGADNGQYRAETVPVLQKQENRNL